MQELICNIIFNLEALYYADDGLVASPQTERLQRAFSVIIDLFNRVGIRANVWKTASMTCQPCYIPGRFPELDCMWRVTGIGASYQERLRRRVEFPE